VHIGNTIADGTGLYLNRLMARFFGHFQLFMFRSGHLVLTEVIWFHFFYEKFLQQEAGVPSGAPNYWWKRLVPPIEFGAMHAILFQLSIIPLTMSRHLLALMSSSRSISKVIPFEHMTEFHIFIGYTFCTVMVLSVILFFIFFGKVCTDFKEGRDPLNLCTKFTSEIMGTGYGIFAATLIVLFSSYFRHKLPFEVFWWLHHFVFLMFFLAMLHTFDSEFRKGTTVGKNRSQTFKWFTASLLIYLGDRMWATISAHRNVPVKSMAIDADNKVLLLQLPKPHSFTFRPGQHAFLQIPSIDWSWHPFSICSEPAGAELHFLIEVKQSGSWTDQLAWKRRYVSGMKVNVMGGFGSSVSDLQGPVEVLAIGTGTGIVPMISLMFERKRRLLMLNKDVWMSANESRQMMRDTELSDPNLRYLQLLWRLRQVKRMGRYSGYLKYIRRQAQKTLGHMIVDVAAALLILVELWLCATMISWSTYIQGTPASSVRGNILRYTTIVTTSLYAVHGIYRCLLPRRFTGGIMMLGEFLVFGVMLAVIYGWWKEPYSFDRPRLGPQVVRFLCSLWRLYWLWTATPPMRHTREAKGNLGRSLLGENTFRFIWACRSADLLMGVVPEFDALLRECQQVLRTTPSGLRKFLDIRMHCTDTDPAKVFRLQSCLRGTLLAEFVSYKRPDLEETIFQVMRAQLADGLNGGPSSKGGAHSLVTFCGSPGVGSLCRSYVEEANLMADTLGFFNHKLVFREEFYGHVGGDASKHSKRADEAAPLDEVLSI